MKKNSLDTLCYTVYNSINKPNQILDDGSLNLKGVNDSKCNDIKNLTQEEILSILNKEKSLPPLGRPTKDASKRFETMNSTGTKKRKYAPDNMRKTIGTDFYNSLHQFINEILSKENMKNNNRNNLWFRKISNKLYNNTTVSTMKEQCGNKIGDIFSKPPNRRYNSTQEKNRNTLNEINDANNNLIITKKLLNITYGDYMEMWCSGIVNNKYPELNNELTLFIDKYGVGKFLEKKMSKDQDHNNYNKDNFTNCAKGMWTFYNDSKGRISHTYKMNRISKKVFRELEEKYRKKSI